VFKPLQYSSPHCLIFFGSFSLAATTPFEPLISPPLFGLPPSSHLGFSPHLARRMARAWEPCRYPFSPPSFHEIFWLGPPRDTELPPAPPLLPNQRRTSPPSCPLCPAHQRAFPFFKDKTSNRDGCALKGPRRNFCPRNGKCIAPHAPSRRSTQPM